MFVFWLTISPKFIYFLRSNWVSYSGNGLAPNRNCIIVTLWRHLKFFKTPEICLRLCLKIWRPECSGSIGRWLCGSCQNQEPGMIRKLSCVIVQQEQQVVACCQWVACDHAICLCSQRYWCGCRHWLFMSRDLWDQYSTKIRVQILRYGKIFMSP